MQHPKVVIIGSGSLFFGRSAIWQMVHSEYLNNGTLALVDLDPARNEKMATLARKVIAQTGVPLKLESSTDYRECLDGADFVVLSFARDTVRYRGIDCEIAAKYGSRMCSGDTIGPGGIFRAMRELPVVYEACREIELRCPQAWVINYINPSAVIGIGLKRFFPQLKTFALCDSLHMPHVKRRYAKRAGIIENDLDFTPEIDRKFDFRIAGPNHYTWLIKAEYEGRDVSPMIAAAIAKDAAKESDGGDKGAKAQFNNAIGYQLYEIFGKVPCCVAHTKEYVRFWQGLNRATEKLPPLKLWETEDRYKRHAEMWEQVDGFLNGKFPIETYMDTFGPDHATDIIENMVGNLGKPFFINTFSDGAVTNMPDDSFLELLCDVDLEGPRPRSVGEMPRGLRGLMEQILDTHELTAEAVYKQDRAILRRAMLIDPIVNSIADADAAIAELLEAEKDIIPKAWYK